MNKKIILGVVSILASTTGFAGLSDLMIRARVIDLYPYESSTTITTIGGKVKDVNDDVAPELDFTYFFNKNIAAELILATTKHNVVAKGTTLDVNGKTRLGSVNLLPPTLLAQYHFQYNNQVDPYVGVGVNYTKFYNQNEQKGLTDISYKNSIGPAFQAGVDVKIQDNWYFNIDVKKAYVKSDVEVTAGTTVVKTTVKLDPVIYGVGIGYRFA